MGCTKRDVAHAVELLEKIKTDLSNLFPRQSNYIQRRTSTEVPKIPSKKSQVDKLPSIPNTYPVNLTAQPVPMEDLKPKRSVARHSSRISQATLSAISQMWTAAVEEAEAEVVTERTSMEVASQTMEQPLVVPTMPEVVATEKSTSMISSQLSVEAVSDKPNVNQEVVAVHSSLKNDLADEEANKYPSTSTLGMLSTMWSTLQESESLSSDNASAGIETSGDNLQESTMCHDEIVSELTTENPSEDEADIPEDESLQTENSVVRPPTPPVHPKRSHLVKEAVASQTSLRQIREDTVSDFTNEFVSPLAVYSHTMVPYQSVRTRFGLHSSLDDSQTQEVEKKGSESQPSSSTMIDENEQLRNSLLDLVPPMRTLEEYYAAESETSPVPPPCSPVSQQESTTESSGKQQEEDEQNVSELN